MISQLAEKAVDVFISCSDINEEDRDLYIYGFFMLFSKVLYFLVSVLFGALFGIVVESIVFYLLFIILREYAGGIHASKEQTCMISTSLAMFASVLAIWIGLKLSLITLYACLFIIGSIVVYVLSPQDTKAKRLTCIERQLYRVQTTKCLFIILFVGGIALIADLKRIFLCCCISITLESVLLLLGKVLDTKSISKSIKT